MRTRSLIMLAFVAAVVGVAFSVFRVDVREARAIPVGPPQAQLVIKVNGTQQAVAVLNFPAGTSVSNGTLTVPLFTGGTLSSDLTLPDSTGAIKTGAYTFNGSSNVADGASMVGYNWDLDQTPTDAAAIHTRWTYNNGAGLLAALDRHGTNGARWRSLTAAGYVQGGNFLQLGLTSDSQAKITLQSLTLLMETAGGYGFELGLGYFVPHADAIITLGRTDRALGSVSSYLWNTKVGSNIASAGTIAPVSGITHITGTTTISTITRPTVPNMAGSNGFTGCIVLIPDGLWSTNTAGNIALATTAVVNKALTECYDSATSKWYPSY